MVDLLLARTGSTLDNDRGPILDRRISNDNRLKDRCGINSDGCRLFGRNSFGFGLLDLFDQLNSIRK